VCVCVCLCVCVCVCVCVYACVITRAASHAYVSFPFCLNGFLLFRAFFPVLSLPLALVFCLLFDPCVPDRLFPFSFLIRHRHINNKAEFVIHSADRCDAGISCNNKERSCP
jgi:hypothetical protein